MKKYLFIFSFLLVFIFLGAACVNAVEIDDSDLIMLENEDMGLSHVDNIDFNCENEFLENNDDEEVSQGVADFNQDLQEESADLDSVDDDGVIISDENEALHDSCSLGIGPANLNGGAELKPRLSEGDLLSGEVEVPGGNLNELNLFLTYMQHWDDPIGARLRETIMDIYDIYIPETHSNTIYLNGDYSTISEKLIIEISSGKSITIDGGGHSINLAGSSKHDHYFVVKSGSITFKNIRFYNGYNKDGDNGGAISFEDSAVGTIINCSFNNCWAENNGGAVADRSGNTLTIIDSTFTSNTADDDNGGAVFSKSNIILRNSTFISNKANDNGGAVYSKNSIIIDGCTFSDNLAKGEEGGAVHANKINLSNAPSYFLNNRADLRGGAIYVDKFTQNVENAVFIGNKLSDDDAGGGAVFIYGEIDLSFYSCVFIENQVTGVSSDGGAVYIHDTDSDVTFADNIFIGNKANDVGNCVLCWGSITVHHNWYGTDNPSFGNEFRKFVSYGKDWKKINDNDYLVTEFRKFGQDDKDINFGVIFSSVSGTSASNQLCIAKDCISFSFGKEVDILDISTESNILNVSISPKEFGPIPVTIKIYDHYLGEGIIEVEKFNPGLYASVDDIIKGEESDVYVEIHLNETINETVKVEFNNQNLSYNLVNGFGILVLPLPLDLPCGSYSVKVFYEGNDYFNSSSYETSFEILEKTTPDNVFEFTTLQNHINHNSAIFMLRDDYFYSSINDKKYKNGVLISQDYYVVDGQGHTIYGNSTARIFDVKGANVTIKNLHFVNFNSSEGAAIYFHESSSISNCNFMSGLGENGGALYFGGEGTVINSTFNLCSGEDGGAVYFADVGSVINSTFVNCSAKYGGAVYMSNGGGC